MYQTLLMMEISQSYIPTTRMTPLKRFIITCFSMHLNQTAKWIFAQGQLETPTEG